MGRKKTFYISPQAKGFKESTYSFPRYPIFKSEVPRLDPNQYSQKYLHVESNNTPEEQALNLRYKAQVMQRKMKVKKQKLVRGKNDYFTYADFMQIDP